MDITQTLKTVLLMRRRPTVRDVMAGPNQTHRVNKTSTASYKAKLMKVNSPPGP